MVLEVSDRSYPAHPLVGVAGIVYRKGYVLMIRRGKAPGKGEWNIPGGLVEVGETLLDAVVREVREETGLEVEVQTLLTVSDRIIRDNAGSVQYHYVLLDYLCRVSGGTLIPGSDAADARWMTSRQLSEIDLSDPVRNVLKKAETLTHGFKGK
jgi:ADP-ribose pyrophosphatase YjhB (NUDIX family)